MHSAQRYTLVNTVQTTRLLRSSVACETSSIQMMSRVETAERTWQALRMVVQIPIRSTRAGMCPWGARPSWRYESTSSQTRSSNAQRRSLGPSLHTGGVEPAARRLCCRHHRMRQTHRCAHPSCARAATTVVGWWAKVAPGRGKPGWEVVEAASVVVAAGLAVGLQAVEEPMGEVKVVGVCSRRMSRRCGIRSSCTCLRCTS